MNILIAGCSQTGAKLAAELSREGHDVSVVDPSAAAQIHRSTARRTGQPKKLQNLQFILVVSIVLLTFLYQT